MTETPNPSHLAAQLRAAADRETNRLQINTARKRRRVRLAARINTHIDPETIRTLARIVHPEPTTAKPQRSPQVVESVAQRVRRTKRRYAHELHPHATEGETRLLEVEVKYQVARAVGFGVEGTKWLDDGVAPEISGSRTMLMITETRVALLAVALHKGLSGDAAWTWADESMHDGELWRLYESAEEYGIDTYAIKPYPCGGEREQHDHLSEPYMLHGFESRTVTRVQGKESECDECTEEIEVTQ